MATWDDLRRIALALPEVAEEGSEHPSWRVKSESFVWGLARPCTDASRQLLSCFSFDLSRRCFKEQTCQIALTPSLTASGTFLAIR